MWKQKLKEIPEKKRRIENIRKDLKERAYNLEKGKIQYISDVAYNSSGLTLSTFR